MATGNVVGTASYSFGGGSYWNVSVYEYANGRYLRTNSGRTYLGGADGYSSTSQTGGSFGFQGGSVNANSLSKLADDATLWGKGIPISGGRRKIPGYMLQMGSVKQLIDYIDWSNTTNTNNGMYWSSMTAHFTYGVDYAFALGYPGDPTAAKKILGVWKGDQKIYQYGAGNVNNMPITFYPGSETQVADPGLKQQFPDQLAYRGLMYGILRGLPADTTVGQIPELWVELSDSVTVTQSVTVNAMTTAGASNNTTPFRGGYDSREGVVWTTGALAAPFSGKDGCIAMSAIDGSVLLTMPFSTLITTAVWPGWTGTLNAGVCFFFGEDPDEKYVFGQSGLSNASPVGVIKATTGELMNRKGVTNNFPDPSIDRFGIIVRVEPVTFRMPDRTKAFVMAYSGLFGNDAFMLQVYDSSLGKDGPTRCQISLKKDYGSFSGTGKFCRGEIDADGNCFAYWCYGTTIERVSISRTNAVAFDNTFYTGAYEVMGVLVARDSHIVIFMTDGTNIKIEKINPKTKAVDYTLTATSYSSTLRCPSINQIAAFNRSEYLGLEITWNSSTFGGKICNFDLMAGVYSEVTDASGETWDSNNPPFWDAIEQKLIRAAGNNLRFISVGNVSTSRVALSTFIQKVCTYCGYNLSDITISGIDDLITGYILWPPFSLQEVLGSLGAVYNFDVFESDGKITVKRKARGGAFSVDVTVPFADLAVLDEGGDDVQPVMVVSRASDDMMPGAVELTYIDADYDYNVLTYTWKRPAAAAGNATGTVSYSLPIVMTQSEAGTLVSRMMYDQWNSRMQHSFRLGPKYLKYGPGDVMKIVGVQYIDTVKITEAIVNADMSVSFTAQAITSEDVPAYVGDAFTSIASQGTLDYTGYAYTIPADIPQFPYSDNPSDRLETYVLAFASRRGTFLGGMVSRSEDNVAYGEIAATNGVTAFGRLSSPLAADASPNSWHTDTISFNLIAGVPAQFASCTSEEALAGLTNLLLYGAPGRWEIISFKTVSNTGNKISITDYLRGQHGTECMCASHKAGDMIILFKKEQLVVDYATVDQLGSSFYYKAAGLGVPLRLVNPTEITFNGNSDRCWPVATPDAAKSGSDIVLTWNGRARDDTSFIDGTGTVTLTDLPEAYELEIYDAAGSTVRTVTGLTSPTYTYTGTNLTADGYSLSTINTLHVIIYQINALGRGFPKDVTLDVH